MSTVEPSCLRDAAMVTFAYCLNGLRDSSVISIEANKVDVQADHLVARLSVVKGRPASTVPLVRYERTTPSHPSPVDLWLRWYHARGNHAAFFALAGERDSLPEQALTRSLERCLARLHVAAPAGSKYTSHSLRIGAHTEQVLLGFPLEVRLARFGWGPRSSEMASTYFDRTIRLSAASFWVFGLPFHGAGPVSPATV